MKQADNSGHVTTFYFHQEQTERLYADSLLIDEPSCAREQRSGGSDPFPCSGTGRIGPFGGFPVFAPSVPDDLQPLASFCNTVSLVERNAVNMSQNADYLGRVAALLTGKSYAIERFLSPEMQARVKHYLATTAYDCVLADHLYVLVNLAATAVPLLLNCHNVESVIVERYAKLEKNFAKRLYARVEAKRLQEAERHACARSVMAMACSGLDRDMVLGFRADLPVFVVPNSVDTDFFLSGKYPSHTGVSPGSPFSGSHGLVSKSRRSGVFYEPDVAGDQAVLPQCSIRDRRQESITGASSEICSRP